MVKRENEFDSWLNVVSLGKDIEVVILEIMDGLSQTKVLDVDDVMDLTSLLAMGAAEPEKLSKNLTLLIARGLELSAEALRMIVENNTNDDIPVKDINAVSANIFTGFTILLEATATSAWTAESNLQEEEAIEANNGTASAAFKGISHIFHMYYTLPPDNGTATLEMSVLHAKLHKEVCEIAQKKVFTVNDTSSIVPAFVAQKKVFTVNDTLFVVPAFNTLLANGCEEADSFGVGIINSDFNPFRYSENSPDVGSEVVGLTVWRGQDRQPVHHLPKPVDMIIPRDKQHTTSSVYKHTGWIRSWDDIAVVPFRPQRARTALTILLDITSTSHPDLDMPHMQLVWQKASAPTADSFKAADWTTVLPVPQAQLYTLQLLHTYNNTNLTSHPYSWLLPLEALNVSEWDIQNNTTFYLEKGKFASPMHYVFSTGVKYAAEDTSVPVKTTFTVSVLETACVYFGENSSHLWEGDGCKVGPLSNTTHLHCRCDHLTKFAGFVPPNPINFDVALSANITENPMGLIAVLSVFGLFLLGCLMARKADRMDLIKVGVTTPPGHKLSPNPDYHYIVTVYTGFGLDASTTSQVSLTVFGLQNESEPFTLRDDRRLLFGGGSMDSFLVSSEEWLGPLTHVHVWHNNTGPSAGWYLSKVVIQHVRSGRVDYFICNKWLALDEDDGRIDRMVFVASPEEMADRSNLISERVTKDFHDDHLLYSVVGRPARSPFTRAQRLACCMSTVYSAMLANIMFFGQGDKFDPPEPIRIMGVEIEPPISLPEIMIAIESAVIVFPINALIVLLYRNAAPKPSSAPARRLADTKDAKPQDTGKGRGCHLPWWTSTVAGLLAFAVSFVAAFFTVLYTLSFGRDKAEAWLTTFLASFITDMILIQPVKVLVAAVVLGLLIRKPTTEDDPPPTEPTGDEEYLQIVAEQPAAEVSATGGPLHGDDLARDRAHRIRRKMWRRTLQEIVIYGTFLSVLMVMSYTERSNLAFHMDNSVRRALEGGDSFSKISDPASYWTWLEQDVLPAVHSPAWYNGRSCEDSLTLPEHLTHVMSPLQLRQVRIGQEEDCTIPDAMTPVVVGCLDEYSTGEMDTGSYSGSWGVATNNTDHDRSTIPSPWHYTYGDINNGFLYVGEHGVYSGGGYTATLNNTLSASLQTLEHLRSNNWLDNRTRAVFMETVLYNPHANLFAVVTMTTEFSITGHVSMATELVTFRIHHDGQVLLLVLRMVLMILLLFSLVRGVLRFNTYVIAYLTDPWSWLEILTITTGMATMGLYFRAQSTADEVSVQEGRAVFQLYRSAAMWYQVYTYLLGTLTCCTLVKFIRLLKFNKHVNALLYTMKKTARPLINFFVMSGIVFTAFALACTMQFILLSMFMTIIMDVYMEVKGDNPEDVGMMGFLWEEACGVAHKIKVKSNRPKTQPPADRERQFTQLDQMHELLEELDRKEKSREKEEKRREKKEKRREEEEKRIEKRNREERNRMLRYSESPSLWFV
ncbi:polycystic kidney disease protein 1-like 2 [Branchiostoma floridae]|uniref:Polycystic kidney disease protein 1-like 2 n=1 Tax=Branchiostoma floridae TaxID=7739 RepID=A0A9J7LWS4_BRAFL|nr:polycystic kidney disease protein 1-like 2 [Branchiostoma floridae]